MKLKVIRRIVKQLLHWILLNQIAPNRGKKVRGKLLKERSLTSFCKRVLFKIMHLSFPTFLLFALNFLDAVLTIYWVRNGFASEGNQLMAGLLDIGVLPFLTVKIAIGATAAVVLWRWGNLRLAKYGLAFSLTVYIGLMGVHFVTGLSAFGFISDNFLSEFSLLAHSVLAFFL